MRRSTLLFLALTLAISAIPTGVSAQDTPRWSPPTTQMPVMPTMADLQGDLTASAGAWLRAAEPVTGAAPAALRAAGTPKAGSTHTQILRFTRGPVPAMVWTDRNGDARADLIEIYRGGTVLIQLIDADYNGQANVMRVYDASGTLIREERL
ncbi:MAG: hypothetical protein H0X65_16480 [Gemmatimonadetes bacterium]|nr:hypothetical protein [Gemmatimonadota bacterium]